MQINISTQIQQLQKQLKECLSIQNQNQTQHTTNTPATHTKNNNLIQKMQAMLKIFINSLKLNYKLCDSINQAESKIQFQTNTLIDVTTLTESKLQETLKRTKQLYEDTVHQNQKARFLLEQFISPIRQQLRSKVDETTFSLQIRMLLDEYDVMGQRITYEKTQQQLLRESKQKAVNAQTLSFLRDHILPVITDVEQRLQKNINKSDLIQNRLDDFQSNKKYLQTELNIQRDTIQQIEKKNIKRINQKMGEQVIQKKIKETVKTTMTQYQKQIALQVEKVNRYSKSLETKFMQQLQQIKLSFIPFLQDQKASDDYFKTQIEKHQKLFKQVDQQKNLQKKQGIQIDRILQKLPEYDKNVRFVNKFYRQFEELKSKVQKGEIEVKQQFKGDHFDLMMRKLDQFQVKSKKIEKSHKQMEERSLIFKGQMQGIRDILSKKANFSDILMHIENKADKQQLKQLKLLIEEGKQSRVERKSTSACGNRENESASSKRKSFKNRSFFSPSPVEKQATQDKEAISVKRFKLGLNTEFLHPLQGARRQYSKTQYLRQTIVNNNSHLVKQMQQE